jgi:uncharacterized membrane protein YvlD (DUF360 family)
MSKLLVTLIKQVSRIGGLYLGFCYGSAWIGGFSVENEAILLAFCFAFSVVETGLRPLLKVLCLPLDMLTFGMSRKVLYIILISVFLLSTLWWMQSLHITAETFAQQLQTLLAVWIFTLTVLIVTR